MLDRRMLCGVVIAGLVVAAGCEETRRETAHNAVPAHDDGWRESFTVDKSKLIATGSSPYFQLQPGITHRVREDSADGGGELVTISVLEQTEVVDGVTTRVVEEREEEGGQLKEISRNFFAIDPATGDVYYFGEDVDIYKDGKVVEHSGAWRSGVNGARFGLFLPGKPRLGEKFYQEVAPGVAMDRVEIDRMDERVETPTGAFEHCVRIEETTPLEKGTGYKWFAPGVGMVKDGKLVLEMPRR